MNHWGSLVQQAVCSAGLLLVEPNTSQTLLLALIWFALPLRLIIEAWAAKRAARILEEPGEEHKKHREPVMGHVVPKRESKR